NEELVSLYYEIGKYLSIKVKNEKWGSKVIENIAKGIKEMYPTLKGFDRIGLYRMVKFYETYKDNEIVSTLLTQIGWANNLIIITGTKSIEERDFYIRMCIKNKYSARELKRQISSGYYFRYMLSKDSNNVLESIDKTIDEDDIPQTKILDYYSLEFLDLPNNFSEKDLRKALVSNLKDFILELGSDFSFIGEEYRVQVGNHDYYIDLLFYNRTHNCLVAIELKIDEFKPEYLSKMNFYLEALDRNMKKENENPSVGIILCASKDDVVVEYTLARNSSYTTVAEYNIDIIDKKILKNKLKELKIELDK
ncbi:MAG: PDDEXK nuclease domain-containing protein, partial [Gammaproteobacteria bacterium]|nr:PDDEXK nuclease domain-containing protein [Gammaproteobacteria bacterium]